MGSGNLWGGPLHGLSRLKKVLLFPLLSLLFLLYLHVNSPCSLQFPGLSFGISENVANEGANGKALTTKNLKVEVDGRKKDQGTEREQAGMRKGQRNKEDGGASPHNLKGPVPEKKGKTNQMPGGSYIMIPLTRNGGQRGAGGTLEQPDGEGGKINSRRHLLEAERLQLEGSVVDLGYYAATVYLGTPPQEFSLITDTGSSITYVPCSSCSHCGKHQNPGFEPRNSSTFVHVPCASPWCTTSQGPSHERRSSRESCNEHDQCTYSGTYAESSSTQGILSSDLISFSTPSSSSSSLYTHSHSSPLQDERVTKEEVDNSGSTGERVIFGCEMLETGDLFVQRADGIMGLGRSLLSLPNQLVTAGAMEDVFSLCFGGMDEGGGALVLGRMPLPPFSSSSSPSSLVATTTWVPMEHGSSSSNYYAVGIESFSFDEFSVDLSGADGFWEGEDEGSMLDSGTTFTYIPSAAFAHFVSLLRVWVRLKEVRGPDPRFNDICFGQAQALPKEELGDHFPEITVHFTRGASLKLPPENYVFKHKKDEGAYCLGIFPNPLDSGTILGAISVRNMAVTYDRGNDRVGFTAVRCSSLSVPPSLDAHTLEHAEVKPELEPLTTAEGLRGGEMKKANEDGGESEERESSPQNEESGMSGTQTSNFPSPPLPQNEASSLSSSLSSPSSKSSPKSGASTPQLRGPRSISGEDESFDSGRVSPHGQQLSTASPLLSALPFGKIRTMLSRLRKEMSSNRDMDRGRDGGASRLQLQGRTPSGGYVEEEEEDEDEEEKGEQEGVGEGLGKVDAKVGRLALLHADCCRYSARMREGENVGGGGGEEREKLLLLERNQGDEENEGVEGFDKLLDGGACPEDNEDAEGVGLFPVFDTRIPHLLSECKDCELRLQARYFVPNVGEDHNAGLTEKMLVEAQAAHEIFSGQQIKEKSGGLSPSEVGRKSSSGACFIVDAKLTPKRRMDSFSVEDVKGVVSRLKAAGLISFKSFREIGIGDRAFKREMHMKDNKGGEELKGGINIELILLMVPRKSSSSDVWSERRKQIMQNDFWNSGWMYFGFLSVGVIGFMSLALRIHGRICKLQYVCCGQCSPPKVKMGS